MQSLSDFKIYLARRHKGKKEAPYSVKVASDIVSRVRKIERLMGGLDISLFMNEERFVEFCESAKSLVEANSEFISRKKAAHPSYISALRLYRNYLISADGRNI
jgi:hypothetical protein